MNVSKTWLQKYIVEPLPSVKEIADKLTMYAFEIESIVSDGVIDVKILPDRAHYALSHYGVASDIAVAFGFTLKPRNEIKLPEISKELSVTIQDTKLCRRYTGAVIKGVKVGPSPEWLRQSLEAIGQRSINNIVDATNYVMFSVGQPTHCFDFDKVKGKISVRQAHKGEQISLIRNTKLIKEGIPADNLRKLLLTEGEYVIADEQEPLALAGLKGGQDSQVDENTRNIILESANFDPTMIRRERVNLAKISGLDLLTDASKRFENELTPELAIQGLSDLIALITEIAGGTVEGCVDIYPAPVQEWNIKVSLKEINDVLGTQLNAQEVEDIIVRFGWKHECVTVEGTRYWSITPPFERLDLKIKEDVIEEVGRIYGYEHIQAKMPAPAAPLELNQHYVWCETLRSLFVDSGYSEVYTYAFRPKGEVEIAYPLAADKAFLRTNLKDGVTDALELNKKYKDLLGLKEIKIFEIGNVFTKDGEEMHVCFANEKEVQEMTLTEAVEHMKIEEVKELPEASVSTNMFKAISPYPFIVRDIAVWIPDATSPEEITEMIVKDSGELLVKGPTKFDQFSKEGRTSYAYRMVYQSMEKTLTIEEVNAIITTITDKMNAKEGWKVR